MRVLLVEEDLIAARGIALMLKAAGAVVDQTDSGEDALELLRHYEYDIVLLDLALPDIEGFEVVRRMRIARNDTPVLVLSGLTMPQARVKALSLGADDFITKPYDKAELLARMQAIVRRSKGFSLPTVRLGRLELNLDSREVLVDGRDVHLTGKEYSILELLVLRKGMVLTKEAFLNDLYGGMDEPEVKIIDVFVCKLRKKIGPGRCRWHHRDDLGPRLHDPRSRDAGRFHTRIRTAARSPPVTGRVAPLSSHDVRHRRIASQDMAQSGDHALYARYDCPVREDAWLRQRLRHPRRPFAHACDHPCSGSSAR
jgi:two-component system cell cycle response regulator CtrA